MWYLIKRIWRVSLCFSARIRISSVRAQKTTVSEVLWYFGIVVTRICYNQDENMARFFTIESNQFFFTFPFTSTVTAELPSYTSVCIPKLRRATVMRHTYFPNFRTLCWVSCNIKEFSGQVYLTWEYSLSLVSGNSRKRITLTFTYNRPKDSSRCATHKHVGVE